MSSGDAAGQKMIVLRSSDEEDFEVEEEVAVQSQVIKHVIEDNCADTAIPLPKVPAKILAKVIEYCKRHVDADADEDLEDFDAEFVKVDQGTLCNLIEAANYLDIESLFHLTIRTLADMIKGKTPEEIRKTFNIKNDFKKNAWTFGKWRRRFGFAKFFH